MASLLHSDGQSLAVNLSGVDTPTQPSLTNISLEPPAVTFPESPLTPSDAPYCSLHKIIDSDLLSTPSPNLPSSSLPPSRLGSVDRDHIFRPEDAFFLFQRKCIEEQNQAEAQGDENDRRSQRVRRLELVEAIRQQWRALDREERQYWEGLAEEKKNERERLYRPTVSRKYQNGFTTERSPRQKLNKGVALPHLNSPESKSSESDQRLTASEQAKNCANSQRKAQAFQSATAQNRPDPFYGHEDIARLCTRFVAHLFACPRDPPSTVSAPWQSDSQSKLPHFIAYALHRTRLGKPGSDKEGLTTSEASSNSTTTNIGGDMHSTTTNTTTTNTDSFNTTTTTTSNSYNTTSTESHHIHIHLDTKPSTPPKRKRRWSITKFIHVPVPVYLPVPVVHGFFHWVWDACRLQWVQSWCTPVVQWFHAPFQWRA